MWNSEQELFDLMRRELFTAVVGDVLDAAGLVHQFLPPGIQPLEQSMTVAGRAMPVLEADCYEQDVRAEGKRRPFGLMLEALDDLQPGEVYVCTGSSPHYALWGELMSTRAQHLGAAGAVVNGPSRDTAGIVSLGFPTFSTGLYAQDQGVRGRVVDFRCEIGFDNGVRVRPGDLIFGDREGVLVVPHEVERDMIDAALEKVRGENTVRKAIQAGMSARQAFDDFGIM
jgi:regulator of RNase E activity RraA